MMNIFVALNDAYYPQLKIFSNSLKKHNKSPFLLTVLFSQLSEKNIADFEKFAKKLAINIRMRRVKGDRSSEYKLIHQITNETYYRFQLLEIFPTEERALWLDIDTVITDTLEPFYFTDFEDNYAAAVSGNNEQKHIERLGLAPDGCYFNAGVILFNLKKLRADFEPHFLYQVYEANEERIRFSDQDVLNIAFSGKVKKMPDRKYNYIIMSGQSLNGLSFKQIEKSATIIHFIRHIKPWQHYYSGSVRYIYLKAMLPIYPLKAIGLFFAGELYKLKKNKKTLENSIK